MTTTPEDIGNWLIAAERGENEGQFYLGWAYANGECVPVDQCKAVYWYHKAAAQGNADAQNNLGYAYDMGECVTQDQRKAVGWYRKAAEQGHAVAQNNLGYAYDTGEGVTQDQCKAVGWYRKAAKQGDVDAQYNLGYAYDYGTGIAIDKSKAIRWYRKAAKQGHAESQKNLDLALDKEKNSQDDSLVEDSLHEAKGQGNAVAQYYLGNANDRGEGITKNTTVYWYHKTAERGDVDAQYNLAVAYDYGEGIEMDKNKAMYWYRKAGDQGHMDAQYMLGVAYDEGEGVTQNKHAAVHWYHKAAKQGDVTAQNELSIAYCEYLIAQQNDNTVLADSLRNINWNQYLSQSQINSAMIEAARRIKAIESGKTIASETRASDANAASTPKPEQESVATENNILVSVKSQTIIGDSTVIDKCVIFDIETTGLSKNTCEIVELAAIKVDLMDEHKNNGTQHASFQTLCNVKGNIPRHATKVHNITKQMTEKHGIPISQAISKLFAFIEGLPVVIYNAQFDEGFVRVAAARERIDIPKSFNVVCALKCARMAFNRPQVADHKLATLAKHVGADTAGAHRALKDCEMTLHVFLASMKSLGKIQGSGRIDISGL